MEPNAPPEPTKQPEPDEKTITLQQAFDRLWRSGGYIWDDIDAVKYLEELRGD